MIQRLKSHYLLPLLISITLIIVFIAMNVHNTSLGFVAIILGTLVGMFFLDLDYVIYAMFIDPSSNFSQTLNAYFKHGDIGNAVSYMHYHKNELTEKTLNSIVFQIVLAMAAIIVVYFQTNYFVKAAVLTALAISIYRLVESIYQGTLSEWFWALKKTPTKNSSWAIAGIFTLILFFCINLF